MIRENSPKHENEERSAPALHEVERRGSEGERQLARMFTRYGVRFEYERPVALREQDRLRLWYPDFWLPDLDVYVEYLGRRPIPGAREEHHAYKQGVYAREGIACLFLGREDLTGNWPKEVLRALTELVRERAADQEIEARRLDDGYASRESGVYTWGRR